jgi:hypothetical protein
MESETNFNSICHQFGEMLKSKSTMKNGVCSLALERSFDVTILGKDASSVLDVEVMFQSLDQEGNALNVVEAPLLQDEVPSFMYAALQQGIIVSAVHNHWLFTEPAQIMYVHLESVEPPLQFARKMAYVFTQLNSPLVAKDS